MSAARSGAARVGERLAGVVPAEAVSTLALSSDAERPLVAPSTEEQWSALLELAGAENWSVLVVGNGTKLGWGNPMGHVDLALTTRRFTGVVAYEPGDGTLTARTGTSLRELARVVAAGSHHLSPDVPRAAATTLGGVLGASQSGLDRSRFGPVRHQLLGARAALADGRVVRSGGRLVKNVTGYDLHRLWCGSHGSLGVLLEASLRLYPAPDERVTLVRRFPDRATAHARAADIATLAVRPWALVLCRRDGGWEVLVALAGRSEVVAWEQEEARTALEEGAGDELRLERGETAGSLYAETREAEATGDDEPSLALGARPGRLAAVLDATLPHAGEGARVVAHPAVGLATLFPSDAAPARLRELHDAASATGARIHWRDAPHAFLTGHDAFAPPSPGLPLMRRLKQALDPHCVFCAGRSHGGL